MPVYGHNSILPKELAGRFFELALTSLWEDEEEGASCGTEATASWDSSLQEPRQFNIMQFAVMLREGEGRS